MARTRGVFAIAVIALGASARKLVSRKSGSKGEIGMLWCSVMHDSPGLPIHGRYEWGVCGRQFSLPWVEARATAAPEARLALLPSLRSTILPVLLTILAACPGRGAENLTPDASSPAAVLQRFLTERAEAAEWSLETMEIDASLPKLNKTGRLLAIRRLLPVGQPDYKFLEIAGDATVKKQLIARYISADERAAELPASSVAMTPSNYRFRYAGTVTLVGRLTHAFRMIPRKKREGLINGTLWLDSATGAVVREAGYLAKNPSIFLKRVNLTRENELRDGTIAARVTHVTAETRLVGRPQLVIVERPGSGELAGSGAAGERQ